MSSRAAGIVAFLPDSKQLLRLIGTIGPAVGCVYVFLNSVIDETLRTALSANPSVRLMDAEENLGIGVGLNMIVLAALLHGFESVILFDQDSQPEPHTIDQLGGVLRVLMESGQTPAVVAPRLIAASDSPDSKAPTYRPWPGMAGSAEATPVQFVPTSGSLIPLDIFRRVGLFRADYFLDGIDVEWSFRAWARGYSCWIVPHCHMQHSVGTGTIALPLIGRRMPDQKPFRMYCLIRNSIYGWRLRHIPARWKAAQVGYLTLQSLAYARHHRFRPVVLRQVATAIVDGLRGHLGVPPAAPDGRPKRDR